MARNERQRELQQALNGAHITPESVEAERLSNVATHICKDSSDLADALAAARDGAFVRAFLGDVEYAPSSNITLPVDISAGGIEMHGFFPNRTDNMSVDGYVAQQGTRVDCDGSTLLTGNDFSGFRLDAISFDNCAHVGEFGSLTDPGVSNVHISDVMVTNNTDYAFKFWNSQIDRIDNLIQSAGVGLIHSIASGVTLGGGGSPFQPGNGVWTELHSSPDGSVSPIKIDARGAHHNYILMDRPQVISGTVVNGDGTAGIEMVGDTGNSVNAQLNVILGADVEGDWQHGVRAIDRGRNNYIHVAGVAGSQEWNVYCDNLATNTNIESALPISVYCDSTETTLPSKITQKGGSYGVGLVNNQNNSERLMLYPGVDVFAWKIGDNNIVVGNGGVDFKTRGTIRHEHTGVKTSNYTTSVGDYAVPVDTTGGAVTVSLASAHSSTSELLIFDDGGNAGTNAITIDTEGAETVNGGASVSISTDYGAQRVINSGGDWVAP